jgi:hypothetical protein
MPMTTTAARKAIIGRQFFMKTSFCKFVNNSSVAWFQATNKIDDYFPFSMQLTHDGTVPADLTVTGLVKALPYSWAEQEQVVLRNT